MSNIVSQKSILEFKQKIRTRSDEIYALKNKFKNAKKALSEILFYRKKYIIPTLPDFEKYIFSGNLNYFSLSDESAWGKGDRDALSYLNSLSLSLETWMNACAGDGRYNNILLEKADKVICCDIDKSALSKLWYLTPDKLRGKLAIQLFNIADKFPFPDGFFDGIFSTGILHLFPKELLTGHIFPEFQRVVKNRGRLIFDFATDIKRICPDGSHRKIYPDEPHYEFNQALSFVKKYFSGYRIKIIKSSAFDNLTKTPGLGYKFSCRYFLADIRK